VETALYLLPVTLGDTPIEKVLPSYNKEIISGIRYFIVEDVRSARRFLKKVDREIDIDALTFYPLNKHTSPEDISGYLQPLVGGASMGVISEAGCPAVADPGADVVAIAQRKKLKVVPLVGPSSIILSVMASGFNGQSFAFHGYLPIEPGERAKKLKAREQKTRMILNKKDQKTMTFFDSWRYAGSEASCSKKCIDINIKNYGFKSLKDALSNNWQLVSKEGEEEMTLDDSCTCSGSSAVLSKK
jgi:16S rRNA C1402 (ribose-2'-O) methylase RsmI